MRVFISEFLVGGASIGQLANESMRHEGLAMVQAIAADINRLPGCEVVTTLEADSSFQISGEVIPIKDAAHEKAVFQSLLQEVDAALVIAPETDGRLAERCRAVLDARVVSWNCSPDSIELCSDKFRFANHLHAHGLATIPTLHADLNNPPDHQVWPVVLKPRDGAGSHLTFLVRDLNDWPPAVTSIREGRGAEKCLIQPFIAGKALSIGVNICLKSQQMECFAVGEQRLSNDRQFRYLGGVIPARISTEASLLIENLVIAACKTIPGLGGYIGIDLILTDQGDPVIVEINPRLTTAYVGYRQLYSTSLPQRWLSSSKIPLTTFQRSDTIEFQSEESD